MIKIYELQSKERRRTKFDASFKIIGLNFSFCNLYLSLSEPLLWGERSFMDFFLVIHAFLANNNHNNNKDQQPDPFTIIHFSYHLMKKSNPSNRTRRCDN